MNLDGKDHVAQATPAAPAPSPLAERSEIPAAHELTYAERQGMAMAWLGMGLGMFILLGGLALGAALVFNVGFGGWLITTGLMGLVVVAAIIAVSYYVMRPRR